MKDFDYYWDSDEPAKNPFAPRAHELWVARLLHAGHAFVRGITWPLRAMVRAGQGGIARMGFRLDVSRARWRSHLMPESDDPWEAAPLPRHGLAGWYHRIRFALDVVIDAAFGWLWVRDSRQLLVSIPMIAILLAIAYAVLQRTNP